MQGRGRSCRGAGRGCAEGDWCCEHMRLEQLIMLPFLNCEWYRRAGARGRSRGTPAERGAGVQAAHSAAALWHVAEAHTRAALAQVQKGLRADPGGEPSAGTLHCAAMHGWF